MNFLDFVAGPLLQLTFLAVIVGILTRVISFFYATLKSGKDRRDKWPYIFVTFGRSLLPYYRAAKKDPLYVSQLDRI